MVAGLVRVETKLVCMLMPMFHGFGRFVATQIVHILGSTCIFSGSSMQAGTALLQDHTNSLLN